MAGVSSVTLKLTTQDDLDFVLALESHPDNRSTIKQWSREQHLNAINAENREHWLIRSATEDKPLGYLIAYDLTPFDAGAYLKRVVVCDKSRGLGRMAIERYAKHAFSTIGADYLWLCVYPENQRGQRCYHNAGFVSFGISESEQERHMQIAEQSPVGNLMLMRLKKGK